MGVGLDFIDGTSVGCCDSRRVGIGELDVGNNDGYVDSNGVGDGVRTKNDCGDGSALGSFDGTELGNDEGYALGSDVGDKIGNIDGFG